MTSTPIRERGAIASMVAVLLGGGVLLGFLAIAVDVGNLMWERRQLQNAADAAAFSLAQSCAEGACSPDVNGIPDLVNANSADQSSGFDTSVYTRGQCGRGIAGLPACLASTNTFTDCPTLPAGLSAAVPYVEAHTQTRSNASTLRQVFAGIIGSSSNNKVEACSRVAFGVPGTAQVPMTFSMCEWNANTDGPDADLIGGDVYYPYDPPYGTATSPLPTVGMNIERTIYLQDHGSSSPCDNFNGHDVPGGFGYLTANGCMATVSLDSWVQIDTGSSSPCNLAPYINKVVYLPVFDCVVRSIAPMTGPIPSEPPVGVCAQGTGNNTYYHIKGWAKFYLSGFKIGGGPTDEDASSVSGTVPCTGGDRCISGWFLDGALVSVPPTSLAPPAAGNPFDTYSIVPAG